MVWWQSLAIIVIVMGPHYNDNEWIIIDEFVSHLYSDRQHLDWIYQESN